MKNAGINVDHRSIDSVISKIRNLEDQFKDVHSWRNQTGQGIIDRNIGDNASAGEKEVKDYIQSKWPYYFTLYDVFSQQAWAEAKHTSERPGILMGSDSDSESSLTC